MLLKGAISTWLEGALGRGWRGRLDVVGGGGLTWLEWALRLRLKVGVWSTWRGTFVVVDGRASMWLKGALRRG